MRTAGLGLARKWRSREKIKRPIIHSFVANSRFDKIHIFFNAFPYFLILFIFPNHFLITFYMFPHLRHLLRMLRKGKYRVRKMIQTSWGARLIIISHVFVYVFVFVFVFCILDHITEQKHCLTTWTRLGIFNVCNSYVSALDRSQYF